MKEALKSIDKLDGTAESGQFVFHVVITRKGDWINVSFTPQNAGRSGRGKYSKRFGYSLAENRWSYGSEPTDEYKDALEQVLESARSEDKGSLIERFADQNETKIELALYDELKNERDCKNFVSRLYAEYISLDKRNTNIPSEVVADKKAAFNLGNLANAAWTVCVMGRDGTNKMEEQLDEIHSATAYAFAH